MADCGASSLVRELFGTREACNAWSWNSASSNDVRGFAVKRIRSPKSRWEGQPCTRRDEADAKGFSAAASFLPRLVSLLADPRVRPSHLLRTNRGVAYDS
jgi:hypothetical protein